MLHNVKRIVSIIVVLLSFSFVLFALPELNVVKAEPKTIVVPDDYLTITDAVGNASEGVTIFVRSGVYLEHTLVIDKALSIVGEDANSTMIQSVEVYEWDFVGLPPPIPPVIQVNADNVTISGLTIDNPLHLSFGNIVGSGDRTQIIGNILKRGSISLSGSYQSITHNTINVTEFGIECSGSYNNITANNVYGSGGGVSVSGYSNMIYGNNITTDSNIHVGLDVNGNGNVVTTNNLTDGVGIGGSNNLIYANIVPYGFALVGHNNTFYANHAFGVAIGNRIKDAANNTFYHNNFVGANSIEIGEGVHGQNFWDNGEEGNYWSNYKGTDKNGDGIGDIPYMINENNTDNYPLIAPITSFDTGTWGSTSYNVDIISNSTVSDFSFNPETALLRFNVEGETGTTGFCRITIPKELLDAEGDWTVLVDGNSLTPTVNEDENNTCLYFTYGHSTKTIKISGTKAIPEFPSWMSLSIVLVVFAVAMLIYKQNMKGDDKA